MSVMKKEGISMLGKFNSIQLLTSMHKTYSVQGRRFSDDRQGPYIVTKIIGNHRYLVEDLSNISLRQRKYFVVIMWSEHMKPRCYGDPSLDAKDKNESNDSSPRRDVGSRDAEM